MVSTLIKGLVVGLIILVIPSLYFETPLFFQQASVQPMKVYYQSHLESNFVYTNVTKVGGLSIGGYGISYWIAPNWNISDLQVNFNDVFSNSNMYFEISYNNLSIVPLGWYSVGNGYTSVNSTEVIQYINSNPPDMLITFPSIKNGAYFCYTNITDIDAFVFGSTYAKSVSCAPLFKHTSFDTWESEVLLDASTGTINLTSINSDDNRTFVTVPIQSMSINLEVPNNYQIQNIGDMTVTTNPNGYKIQKDLTSGETFDLVVKDSNLEQIQSVMNYVSSLGIPTIFIALLIDAFIEYRQAKSKKSKTKRTRKYKS
jgi:hypothetical protein